MSLEKKNVFIINGTGGCGKDSIISFISEIEKVMNISSVDKVKEIATIAGWTGGKTEKDRKFLSDLKILFQNYNDLPFESMNYYYNKFLFEEDLKICFFHIREPDEIERAKQEFNAQTILVINNNIKEITTNMADSNVYDYTYDIIIDNSGDLEDLKESAKTFLKWLEIDFKIGESAVIHKTLNNIQKNINKIKESGN